MKTDRRFALVLLCFLLSGLAALIYQTAWTREFAFIFGTSELAVATVLAAYMGGLAAGAAAAARFSPRVTRPVLVYGLLELGIAVSALLVPLALRASTHLYRAVFGAAAELPDAGGLTTALFYLACSFLILMIPTGLMGATLPMLARYAVRRDAEIGWRIGVLYSANTVGAVLGTVLAGFVLLPSVGLRPTVWVAVAVNFLVFMVAVALARSVAPVAEDDGDPAATSAPSRGRWVLPVMLASGIASFTYEVLWTRLLGHLLGGSVYAFSTMLASFLVGIALGSAVGARLATTRERATRGFGWTQIGIAACSLAAFFGVDLLPELALQMTEGGAGRGARNSVLAALTLLPGALCIGATLPLAVRILARDAHDAGPASARVYAWNTTGAIVGAVGAGFFIVPAMGYAGALSLAVAVNLGLALAAGGLGRPRGPWVAGVAIAGLAALAWAPVPTPWKLLRSGPLLAGTRPPVEGQIAYYAVGRSTTVLLTEVPGGWSLRTNGLPEATIFQTGSRPGRFPAASWLSLLPALARPEAESMLVVGLGGGNVLEAVPPMFQSIAVIELEPEVVAANRSIARGRRVDPLSDPRILIRENDARSALFLSDRRFDAVVSQPSHPWTAGASHLYTREFFDLVSQRLTADGVFVQWIGASFVDESLLRSLVATLLDVFPNVRIYQPEGTVSILFIASEAPLPIEETAAAAIASAPTMFARRGLLSSEDVAASLLFDEAGTRKLARGARISRDDHNLLQTGAPRILGSGLKAKGVRALMRSDPLASEATTLDRVYLTRRMLAKGMRRRARRVADSIADPAARATAAGFVDKAGGRRQSARTRFREALAVDSRFEPARAGLFALSRGKLLAGTDADALLPGGASASERAFADAWRAFAAKDWHGLRDLDAELARLAPDHPLYFEAVRLRCQWRAALGDRAAARAGIDLIDPVISIAPRAAEMLLRAQLAAAARDTPAAMASLSELSRHPIGANDTDHQKVLLEGRRVLAALPPHPPLAARRAGLDRALRARHARAERK